MEIKDILEMLKSELLTEEQQTEVEQKLNDLVDLKVQDKLTEAIEKEKESLIELYEEKFETYKQDITSKFSDFVDTILEEELIIPDEVKEFARKGELYSDLIEEFKVRIGIDEGVMEEETKELLGEARDEIVSLREQVNELTSDLLESKGDAKSFAVELYKREQCDGLTERQRDRVLRLLEGINDPKEIKRKFEIIMAHYLKEQDDEEEAANECTCPDCGKSYSVNGACSMNECDDCGTKLKDKVSEAQAEVKDKEVEVVNNSPFDAYKKNVLKVLKENKF